MCKDRRKWLTTICGGLLFSQAGKQADRPDNGNYLERGEVISHDQLSAYTHIMQKNVNES